jgi:TPR repeat protein
LDKPHRLISLIILCTLSGPVGAQANEDEKLFWQSISVSKDGAEFCAYLAQFPKGNFVSLAKIRAKKFGGKCVRNSVKKTKTKSKKLKSAKGTKAKKACLRLTAGHFTPKIPYVYWHQFKSPKYRKRAQIACLDALKAAPGNSAIQASASRAFAQKRTWKAARHFAEKASHSGYSHGRYRLAYILGKFGNKTEQKQAGEILIDLFSKGAANVGIPLGIGYFTGIYGLRKNTGKAIKTWEKAFRISKNSVVKSRLISEIALTYRDNLPSRKLNYKKALALHKLGIKLDPKNGINYRHIGNIYAKGQGVKKSWHIARAFYTEGAARADVWSYVYLARIYRDGQGVAKNLKKAAKLYQFAIIRGNKAAGRDVKVLLQQADAAEKRSDKKTKALFTILTTGVIASSPPCKKFHDWYRTSTRTKASKLNRYMKSTKNTRKCFIRWTKKVSSQITWVLAELKQLRPAPLKLQKLANQKIARSNKITTRWSKAYEKSNRGIADFNRRQKKR